MIIKGNYNMENKDRNMQSDWNRNRREQNSREQNRELSKPRMANLELLRCLAMMMVVVLHYLGKGNLLPDLTKESLGSTGMLAWLLEAFCIVAVNVYMLISGYFLCTSSFKLSRLIGLYLQVWVYSVGVGLLAYAVGIYPAEEFSVHYLLTLALPVSMGHYWFMTAYVFLYLLLPLFGMAVRNMSRQQMRISLGMLLFTYCILKSILPARLEMDGQGYDCLWYLCVFLTAAYIRRFGCSFLEKKGRALCLYLLACAAVFGETMCLRLLYLRTGSLEHVMKIAIEYNHIFPFLASVGLFGLFLRISISGRFAGAVKRIAPYTLGVYLLHENLGVRYAWQKWFHSEQVDSVAGLFIWTAAAVVCVFAVGILVDAVRAFVMKLLHEGLCKLAPYRRLVNKVRAVDEMFRVK